MKKKRKTVTQKRLEQARAELAAVRKEANSLRADVASLQKERSLQLFLRAIHTDVDSIKHMVRGLTLRAFPAKDRASIEELEELVGDRWNDVSRRGDPTKGKFADTKK